MVLLHYAGIGIRDPTDEQRELCRKIGCYMAAKGWVLHSGGADGCDSEFALGAAIQKGRVRVHLPWDQYSDTTRLLARRFPYHVRVSVLDQHDTEALASVQTLHPSADKLVSTVIRLHARNYRIIKPDDVTVCRFVVALPSNKPSGGGTGQGIRVAANLGIPVVRLDQLSSKEAKAKIEEQIALAILSINRSSAVDMLLAKRRTTKLEELLPLPKDPTE